MTRRFEFKGLIEFEDDCEFDDEQLEDLVLDSIFKMLDRDGLAVKIRLTEK